MIPLTNVHDVLFSIILIHYFDVKSTHSMLKHKLSNKFVRSPCPYSSTILFQSQLSSLSHDDLIIFCPEERLFHLSQQPLICTRQQLYRVSQNTVPTSYFANSQLPKQLREKFYTIFRSIRNY